MNDRSPLLSISSIGKRDPSKVFLQQSPQLLKYASIVFGLVSVFAASSLTAAPQQIDVNNSSKAVEPGPELSSGVGDGQDASAAQPTEEQQLIDAILQSTEGESEAEVGERSASDLALRKDASGFVRFSFERTPWREVIRWIADEAGLALHVGEVPTGSFSYADPSDFTIQEAIDRINLFLQPEGYAILRSGQMLSVINLGDPRSKQQLDSLARMVEPEDLASLPSHDVVRCLFPLGEIDAQGAVAELEVLNLMVTPEVLGRTNQLLMIETVAKLKSVKKILEAFQFDEMENGTVVQSFSLNYVSADDVLDLARPHLGLAPGEMIGIDVSVSADIRGKHLYVTGVEDKVKLLEGLINSIDQPDASMKSSDEPSELRRHLVEGGNVDTVYNVLQTLLAGRDVRLSVDVASSSIVAWAPTAVQNEIQQTVMQLQAAEADFEVIPLRTADPYFVISLLEEMLDLPGAFADPDDIGPNTPRIDADPANRRLFVRAKRPQLDQIKKIVEGLDGPASSKGTEVTTEPADQTRLLPMQGSAAVSLLEAAAKFWRGQNPVVVYEPVVREQKPTERVLTKPDSGGNSNLRMNPGADSQGRSSLGRDNTVSRLGEAYSNRGMASSGVVNRGSENVNTTGRWLAANTESDQPVIRCQLLPDGLLIQCEDVQALDEFESHLQTIAGPSGSTVSPTIVFYLKYALADDALRMLSDLIEGGEIAAEVSDSSLVNGYVPSASYYGAFLTSRDGMLTLSAGTMTVVSDSRLNRLIAQGTTQEIDKVDEYLQIIDKDNSITSVEVSGASHVISLDHASATDVAETLRSAFAGRVVVDDSKQDKQPAASGAPASPRSSDNRDDKKADPRNAKGGQAIMDRAPKMTIAVHEPSNSIIVTAPEQLFQEVERLAKVIDSMAEQTVEVIAPSNGAVFESVLMRYLGQEGAPRSSSSQSRSYDRREPTPSSAKK